MLYSSCFALLIRMMGYLIRFVHNRDKATENIVTAYTRTSFLLAALEYTGADFCERLHDAAVQLPNNSSLHSANTVLVTFCLMHVFFTSTDFVKYVNLF